MGNFIIGFIVILLLWAVIALIGAYWQIILALAAVGLIVYVLFRSDKQPANVPEENFTYEAKRAEPQLPPMPYSEREPEETAETLLVPLKVSTYVDEDGNKWRTATLADGSWYAECGVGEPFETYYNLSEIICTSKAVDAKLAACEEQYKNLPEFVRAYLKDSDTLPNTIPCRDIGVELYLRLGEWDKARVAIEKCIKAGVYDDNGQAAVEHCRRYRKAAELALAFLRGNAGFLQKNLYDALPDADRDCLKSFTRSSYLIRKEKAGKTNKLYVREAES